MASLYEVLGVKKNATPDDIKSAYRKMSKSCHPDVEGGSADKFRAVQEAFDVLSNDTRRQRYDKLGRTDEDKVTEKAITDYLDAMMSACVDAEDANGNTDDPSYTDIRERLLITLQKQRVEIADKINKVTRKIRRAEAMIRRFKVKEGLDLVGKALNKKLSLLKSEKYTLDDLKELSLKAEEVFRRYSYEVGPQSEGQDNQGPTSRRSGVQFLTSGTHTLKFED